MQAQARRLTSVLRKRAGRSRMVLHPEKNKMLVRWDLVTTFALLYTASLTPFETSFIPPTVGAAAWRDPWFIANRCLDGIFGIDLVVQFFVAYQTGNDFGGRQWVLDHQAVIKHYLFGWFLVDLLTVVVPLTFDIILANMPDTPTSTGGGVDAATAAAEKMGTFRVLRVARLVKLVRLIRASRLFERWKSKLTLSYGTQTMIMCVFGILGCAHFYACIIALSASMHANIQDTWVGENLYGLCGDESAMSTPLLNPGPLVGCESLSTERFYLASLTWSLMIITGTGGTDFYPSQASDAETGLVCILVVIGALLWTYVLALFCDIATNSMPALTVFRQRLDGLNLYISINSIPPELARQLRTFMHQQKGVQLREDAKLSLPHLSPALQVEVALHVHKHWLNVIFFIKDLEAPVKVRLAMAMEPKVLAPGEVAPNRHLYVISRGSVIFGGRVLSRDMAWGDDVILENPDNFVSHLGRALTYVDVTALSRETLYDIVSAYPNSLSIMNKCTAKLALRRMIISNAKMLVRHMQNGGSFVEFTKLSKQSGASLGFLNKVDDALGALSVQKESMNVALALEKSNSINQRISVSDGEGGGGGGGGGGVGSKAIEEALAAFREELQLMRADITVIKERM